jgi:protein-S-isoprenylcysteine O-methyltransferase Ste14
LNSILEPSEERGEGLSSNRTNLLSRLRVPLGFVVAIVFVVFSHPTWPTIAAGLPVALAGVALRAWASGHLRKNSALATGGPYAYTRNPLYFGSFLMVVGCCLGGGSWLLALFILATFLLVYLQVMMSESEHMSRLFETEYRSWASEVPLFLPRLTAYRAGTEAAFDRSLYLQHREYRAFAGVITIFLVLALKVVTPVLGAEATRAPLRDQLTIPFPPNERLVFEIRFARFPINASVGLITFDYLGPLEASPNSSAISITGAEGTVGGSIDLKQVEGENYVGIRASAMSQGFLVGLLGLDFQGRFETILSGRNFAARLNVKEQRNGKERVIQTAEFDPVLKKIRYVTRDLSKPQAPPKTRDLPLRDGTQSLISSLYYLRLQALKDGEVICIPVSQDEQNHEFEIIVRNLEVIEIGREKVMTVKVEAKVFGPGRFYPTRQGTLNVWITDDARRLPVRLVAKTTQGTITGNLTNYLQQPPLRQMLRPAANR